jgi:IS30 family transposase
MRPGHKEKLSLDRFDERVKHLYATMQWSTYRVATILGCTQGKVARSLRRTNTQRRSYSEAAKLSVAA